jgi:hypothetical protein
MGLEALDRQGLVIRRGRKGRPQIAVAREKQWSARSEAVFLTALATTHNVTASAGAAGFSSKTVWERRRTDAGFAAEWDAAAAQGHAHVEMLLIEEAVARMARPGARIGEAGASGGGFDPELAMWLLKRQDAKQAGKLKRGGRYGPPLPPMKDVTESILRKIDAIEKHGASKKLAAGWSRDEEGNWIPPGWVRAKGPEGEAGP